MIDKLTLTYNRTRQAVITKELIEIISGAAALDWASFFLLSLSMLSNIVFEKLEIKIDLIRVNFYLLMGVPVNP